MGPRLAYGLIGLLGATFAVAFAVIVMPALPKDGWDIPGAFAAGFVNPYSSGYSLDTILSGLILLVWVLHERRPWGWVAIPLTFTPGMATALAYYLILRAAKDIPNA